MAVVDAAVGIKTAVNFHNKKNKLGTYQPPLGVLYDTAFLHTLEGRHISNGSAEVLKMACIKDAELFQLLATHGRDMIDQKFQVGAQFACRGSGKCFILCSRAPQDICHARLHARLVLGWFLPVLAQLQPAAMLLGDVPDRPCQVQSG